MKKKIFVVDDDPDIRRISKSILEKEYEVEVFSHWEDLKRRLVRSTPHLLVLDIMFDDGTILDFLEYRARHSSLQRIPAIIFSALRNKKIVNQVMTYKVADYIVKPFKPKLLENTVHRVLVEKDPTKFFFKDQEPFKIDIPIVFNEVSEIYMNGECDVRLEENKEYHIEAEFFEKYELPTENLVAIKNSFLSSESRKFVTPFRIRGANEKFLIQIRKGVKE